MLMLSAQQIRLRRITGKFTTSAETDPRASYRARGTAEGAPGPALRQCARRRPGITRGGEPAAIAYGTGT